jgi:LPS-assembly protein
MVRNSLLTLALVFAAAVSAAAQTTPAGCGVKWDFKSTDFLKVNENHYRLIKNVQVNCNDVQFFADEAEVFSDINRVRASGNVLFVSSSNRISADRMEFNTKTKTGTFYNASGIASLEGRGVDRSLFGTQEPDAFFWGDTIEKLGPKTYRISKGGFTTCVQPTPRWELVSNEVTLTLEKHAFIKNAVLKVKDVPVFYLPAMYYPINKEDRATGFLIPIYGSSDIKGQTLSNAFFWAIDRSQDATLYHSFYSKSGQSFGGEYRYVQSAGSSGNLQTTTVREPESIAYQEGAGTTVVPGIDSFTVTGSILQQLPARLRLTGNANYFSSLAAQQRYQQNITAATNRNRNFGVNVAGSWKGHSISATVDRNETFTDDDNSTINGSLPRVVYTRSESKIGGSPLYFGATSEYVTIVRTGRTPDGDTPLGLSRFDVSPTIRFPFTRLQFLTFNSSVRYHDTFWSESQDPLQRDATGQPVRLNEGIERRFFEFTTAITGPVFQKIFNTETSTYAQKFKHVIEPMLTISRSTLVQNIASIVPLESYDLNPGGNTQYTYGLSSRLYAKKENAREILSASLQQAYYTREVAASVDPDYASNLNNQRPPGNFSPLTLQVHASPTLTTDATLRAEFDSKTQTLTALAVNGALSQGWVVQNVGWSLNRRVLPPPAEALTASHYLRSQTVIRSRRNAWSGIYAFDFDMLNKSFLNQRIIAHYNSQCCGIAVEFQKWNFGTRAGTVGLPLDKRFNLSFTLAGIGTFSDLFGAFGGQQGR